jgi:cytochrome b561
MQVNASPVHCKNIGFDRMEEIKIELDPVDARYDPITIWLHWATVGLIGAVWIIGQTADLLPRGPFRTGAWSIHVLLGLATGFVLLTRVAWRTRFGRILPPADTGILHAIAKVTHYTLYLLLGVVVVTGLFDASYRGFNLFGVWALPQFGTGDSATRHSIDEWHELAANLTRDPRDWMLNGTAPATPAQQQRKGFHAAGACISLSMSYSFRY